MQRKNRKFLKLSGLFFSPCSTWWNILLSGRNRNAASCTLPTFTMRKSVTTGKNSGCTSSIRRKYCHISIKSISPLARQNTKISSASCSIKVVVKARFVSLKTPLETRSKGARSLHESSSSAWKHDVYPQKLILIFIFLRGRQTSHRGCTPLLLYICVSGRILCPARNSTDTAYGDHRDRSREPVRADDRAGAS